MHLWQLQLRVLILAGRSCSLSGRILHILHWAIYPPHCAAAS